MSHEDGNTESCNTWTADGSAVFAIAMSNLNGGDQDYVGLVDLGTDVAYGDRIADRAPRSDGTDLTQTDLGTDGGDLGAGRARTSTPLRQPCAAFLNTFPMPTPGE